MSLEEYVEQYDIKLEELCADVDTKYAFMDLVKLYCRKWSDKDSLDELFDTFEHFRGRMWLTGKVIEAVRDVLDHDIYHVGPKALKPFVSALSDDEILKCIDCYEEHSNVYWITRDILYVCKDNEGEVGLSNSKLIARNLLNSDVVKVLQGKDSQDYFNDFIKWSARFQSEELVPEIAEIINLNNRSTKTFYDNVKCIADDQRCLDLTLSYVRASKRFLTIGNQAVLNLFQVGGILSVLSDVVSYNGKFEKIVRSPEIVDQVSDLFMHFLKSDCLSSVLKLVESNYKGDNNLEAIASEIPKLSDHPKLGEVLSTFDEYCNDFGGTPKNLAGFVETVSLYHSKSYVDVIAKALTTPNDFPLQRSLIKMFKSYAGTKVSAGLALEIARENPIRSEDKLDEIRTFVELLNQDGMRETMEQYSKNCQSSSAIRVLKRIKGSSRSKNFNGDSFKELMELYLKDERKIGFDNNIYDKYYSHHYFNINDSELRNNLTSSQIRTLVTAYQIVQNTCQDWQEESQEIVRKGFFNNLNQNVIHGKSLIEKKGILNEYCRNVTRMVEENPGLFMLAQPTVQYTNQQMGVVA